MTAFGPCEHFERRVTEMPMKLCCIGHTRLTHQYLLRREEPPQRPSCNCALTVVHTLLECQQYNSVRQKYFSVTTLKELFDTVNSDDILSFLIDIRLYSRIYVFLFYCSSFVSFHTFTVNILLFLPLLMVWH